MEIILASSNKEKIKEIKAKLSPFLIRAYSDIIEEFEIEETGKTFQENAIIKSQAIYHALKNENFICLSDDSGLSVPSLGGMPGVYSARFASSVHHNSAANNAKLISMLKEKNLSSSPAFYTSCMAISCKWGDFSVHGYMHGKVIDELRGGNGFGYDPLFIPEGWDQTLGENALEEKLKISHRSKALKLIQKILNSLPKGN